MIGISTCWWQDRSAEGEALIREALDMGFEGLELEYRITDKQFHQMRPYLNKSIKVLSIHNYFPRSEAFMSKKASGDYFRLSSSDLEERSLAIRYTVRTMEYASDLETKAVVLHLGHVDMEYPVDVFRELNRHGRIDQDEGKIFIMEQMKKRKKTAGKNLDAVLFSMEELNREAEEKGLFLGLENRYHLHEIPDFDEIGIILKEFKGGRLRYWHDMGHAAVQEKLGICLQKDLLTSFSENLLGIHIHDTKGTDDHRPPGSGDVDLRELLTYIKDPVIKILEISPKWGKGELMEGAAFLKDITG